MKNFRWMSVVTLVGALLSTPGYPFGGGTSTSGKYFFAEVHGELSPYVYIVELSDAFEKRLEAVKTALVSVRGGDDKVNVRANDNLIRETFNEVIIQHSKLTPENLALREKLGRDTLEESLPKMCDLTTEKPKISFWGANTGEKATYATLLLLPRFGTVTCESIANK